MIGPGLWVIVAIAAWAVYQFGHRSRVEVLAFLGCVAVTAAWFALFVSDPFALAKYDPVLPVLYFAVPTAIALPLAYVIGERLDRHKKS